MVYLDKQTNNYSKKMKTFKLTLFFSFIILGISAQLPIGETTITFNDPSRTGGFGNSGNPGRQIQCEIYYPAVTAGQDEEVAAGTFPVIVFGHGFVMAWDAYQNVWEHLVPEGYIMVFPRTEGDFSPDHNEFGLDFAFLVGEMQALNNDNTSLFHQHVTSNTAIIGHSMGGGASFLAAENNTDIATVIGLAPAETNPSAIDAATNAQVPALVFSGTADGVTPPVDHHIPIYDNVTTCKYRINITGGAHCYFANSNFNCDTGEVISSSGITVTRQDQQDIMNDCVTPWLDYYLKNDVQAQTDFTSGLDTDNRITDQESCAGTGPSNLTEENMDVLVYPNPVKELLTITAAKNVRFTVTDLSGRKVKASDVFQMNNQVDVSELEKGTYLIRLESGSGKQVIRSFVKK